MKNSLIEKGEPNYACNDDLFSLKLSVYLHEKGLRFKEEFSKKCKVLSAKQACTYFTSASFSLFKMTSTFPF